MKFYNDKEVERLLEVAWNIRENPSQLHASFRHKDAPQTPDFDWNVYVDRLEEMMKQDRIKNNPIRQSRMALNALNADLTYDNRNKAKELIKKVVEELSYRERENLKEKLEETEKFDEEQKMFRASTTLSTDEFWLNIGGPAPQAKPKEPQPIRFPSSWCNLKEVREPVLAEEKQRYEELKVSLKEISRSLNPNREEPSKLVKDLF